MIETRKANRWGKPRTNRGDSQKRHHTGHSGHQPLGQFDGLDSFIYDTGR